MCIIHKNNIYGLFTFMDLGISASKFQAFLELDQDINQKHRQENLGFIYKGNSSVPYNFLIFKDVIHKRPKSKICVSPTFLSGVGPFKLFYNQVNKWVENQQNYTTVIDTIFGISIHFKI